MSANIRKLFTGVLAGVLLTTAITSGLFDEAGSAKAATTAWCAGTCR